MAESSSSSVSSRVNRVGPDLSFHDANVTVVENSFVLQQTDRSPSGYTVYKLEFKVRATTPRDQLVVQECAAWKRFSDFQNLAKQLESIHTSVSATSKFPYLVKANYFDRFKDSVIEERRVSAERLLQFASETLHLSSSIPFTDFLTGSTVLRILPLQSHLSDNAAMATAPTHNPTLSSVKEQKTVDEKDEEMVTETDLDDDMEIIEGNLNPVIRSNSLMVSEWGLEHTLKLRDESKSDDIPLIVEPKKEKATPPKNLSVDNPGDIGELKEGEDLPLPSTPVITSKPTHKTDWWSRALDEGGGVVDDYDSLIEKLESEGDTIGGTAKQTGLGVQSKTSRSPSPSKDGINRRPAPSANGEYILQAGKLITFGLEYEKKGDIEEAFDLFKAGVDVLLSGVQADKSSSRREAVRKKTAEYLQYTEMLQKKLESKENKKKQNLNSNAKPHLINDFKIISVLAKTVLFVESVHTTQRFVFKVLHKSLTAQQKSQQKSRTQGGKVPRSKNRSPAQCPYMVNLLHHYETQSNRIFLLLEHVSGGQLVQHVHSIRHPFSQKKKQLKNQKINEEDTRGKGGTSKANRVVIGGEERQDTEKNPDQSVQQKVEKDEEEDLLAKLKELEPPMTHPVLSSLTSVNSESSNEEDSLTRLARIVKEDAAESMRKIQEEDGDEEEDEESEDSIKRDKLGELRKQLMESFLEDEEDPLDDTGTGSGSSLHGDSHLGDKQEENAENVSFPGTPNKAGEDEEMLNDSMKQPEFERPEPLGEDIENENDELSELKEKLMAFVSKPSIPDDDSLKPDGLNGCSEDTTNEDTTNIPDQEEHSGITSELRDDQSGSADNVIGTTNDASSTSIQVIPPTPTASVPKLIPTSSTNEQSSDNNLSSTNQPIPIEKDGGKRSPSSKKSPEFSPVVSLRGSPDTSLRATSVASREAEIEKKARKWTAQIVKALEHLHANGIVCKDLHPGNILLTASGDIRLTYFGKWDYVVPSVNTEAVKKLYLAPELLGVEDLNPISDWWSLGAILFEIIVGKRLVDCHPGGVHSHIPLTIPVPISPEANSLLQGFLQVNPHERLGAGMNGIEDIKSHPFFQSIDWSTL